MAEETKPAAAASEEVVVISDVPEAEKPADVPVVTEKELPAEPVAEPEKPAEAVAEAERTAEQEKITESTSFKEETNVVGELPDPQKVALDELKALVQEALNKHEFTAPAPPPPAKPKEEEKPAEPTTEEKPAEHTTEEKPAEPTTDEKPAEETPKTEEKAAQPEAPASAPEEAEAVVATPQPAAEEPAASEAVAEVVEKVKTTVVDEDGAKTVEAIEETVVAVAAAPATEESAAATAPAEPETETETETETAAAVLAPPEEVSIWGIPLLADSRSDVVLLKFLRARDFKVKDAFAMLKSVVAWRKEFKIESLLEEDFGTEQDKVVYLHGYDKEGHPVCYNAFGEYQNKELYQNTFADEEKRTKFLRWRIQFLEKSIRKLDFSPDGINSFVQITDLKNSPGFFQRELRLATNQALQLLQDNYPEFVAKQVFINVPWWYLAFYKMINPFFTQRTKSKFVFAGPSKTAETLFKYISPEQVPVQYGGLSKEEEFTTAESVTEEIVKPAVKHTIEFPVTETCLLVWEARVIGWDVSYGAEFVPSAEDGYTVIVQKSRKVGPTDEPVISGSFKVGEPGKVVLTFDNQTSKKKKLLYRSKTKASE